MDSIDRQYKVLMLCFPASGHLNPLLCYGAELAKNKNVKVIMYNSSRLRKAIESANIEFRPFEHDLLGTLSIAEARKALPLHKMMSYFMEATNKILAELIRCVQEEGIDLVIYDFMTVYAKWLMKRLRAMHQRGELKRSPPKAILFNPSLFHEKNVYPNSFEAQLAPIPLLTLDSVLPMVVFFAKYALFCYRHELPIDNPLKLLFNTKEEFNICCILPEFQPRSHLFPNSTRFVGPCASEESRKESGEVEPLKSFLAPFPHINPQSLDQLQAANSKKSEKLIYISLGTVANTDVWPFQQLINAVQAINESCREYSKFKYLMSTGPVSFDKIQEMVRKGEIKVPDNLLILSSVPQLDVLKRASLFITHSGQGSTSEAIHYGVPMVCIPVMADQPFVAYRVADELGLGIRLDYGSLTPESIKNAAIAVLTNKFYLERALTFSAISKKYNGAMEATRLTIEYLQNVHKC